MYSQPHTESAHSQPTSRHSVIRAIHAHSNLTVSCSAHTRTFAMAALKINPINFLKIHKLPIVGRGYASKTATGAWPLVDKVVTTSDNKVFVAWHPSREFPYECSRPLPPVTAPSSSLLRDEAIQSAMKSFTSKHPEMVRQELASLTYTTIHKWRPMFRIKKAKKTPMDREYL